MKYSIKSVILNGTTILDAGTEDVMSLGTLSQNVSDTWEVEGSSVELVVPDPTRSWVNLLRVQNPDTPMVLELINWLDEQLFIGEVDPVQCTWIADELSLTITATDAFLKAKSRNLTIANWSRPVGAYDLRVETKDIDTKLQLKGVEGLYPDDEIEARPVDDEGNAYTVKFRLLAVHPEHFEVTLDKEVGRVIPVDTTFTRINHELRFVPFQTCLDKMLLDLNSSGLPVTITNETSDFSIGAYALYPHSVPQHPTIAGSVVVQCASLDSKLVCAYVSNALVGTTKTVLYMDFGGDATFDDWIIDPARNSSGYPVDWIRNVAAPPTRLYPGLFSTARPAWQLETILEKTGDPETSATTLPDSLRWTTVNYGADNAYEVRQMTPDPVITWAVFKWVWDAGLDDWVQDSTINGSIPNFLQGIAVNASTEQIYSMELVPAGSQLLGIASNGSILTLPCVTERIANGGFYCYSRENILYASTEEGGRILLIDESTFDVQTIEVSNTTLLVETLLFFGGNMFVVSSGKEGTIFHKFIDNAGTWEEDNADVLTTYPVATANTTIVDDKLWVGAGGLLWVWSNVYTPMLVRADVEGMTIADLLENLLLLGNSYCRSDNIGGVTITPKNGVFTNRGDVGEPGEHETMEIMPNWEDHAQTVKVKGRGDQHEGIAVTGVTGDTLEISSDFIETSSHADAIAVNILNWVKWPRQQLNGVTSILTELNGLDTILFEGDEYLILYASIELSSRPVTGLDKPPVFEYTAIERAEL